VLTGEPTVLPQRSWAVEAPSAPSWGGRLPNEPALEAEERYGVPSGPTHEAAHSLVSSVGFENRDLDLESHIVAMGLWNRINAALMAVGAVCLILGAAIGGAHAGILAGGALVIVAVVLAGFAALCWALGNALQQLTDWARIVSMVFCGLGVLGQVMHLFTGKAGEKFGALLAVAFLVYQVTVLNKASAICTPAYRDTVASSGIKASPYKSIPFFWLPLVGFGLILVGGFLIAFAAAAMHTH
jgi:hypothetical protein